MLLTWFPLATTVQNMQKRRRRRGQGAGKGRGAGRVGRQHPLLKVEHALGAGVGPTVAYASGSSAYDFDSYRRAESFIAPFMIVATSSSRKTFGECAKG